MANPTPIGVVINGIHDFVPQMGSKNWGNYATKTLVDLATYSLFPTGGNFTLTNDVNFGNNFGILAKYFSTGDPNPATAGHLRLSNTNTVRWRNGANTGNDTLSVDTSDNLLWNGIIIPVGLAALADGKVWIGSSGNLPVAQTLSGDVTVTDLGVTSIGAGRIVNSQISNSAAIAYAKLSLSGSILNSDIYSGAAIDYSKLNLSASIVNADIATAAAIAITKLANGTADQVLGTNHTGTGNEWKTITGTTSQVAVVGAAGTITLSTPQNIATSSSPTFAGLTLGNQGAVVFQDTAGTPKSVTVEAPTTITTSYTLKLPLLQGGASNYLQNDGSGNLSWAAAGTGTVNAGTAGQLAFYATSTAAVSGSSATISGSTITASLTGHASLDLALTGGTMSGPIILPTGSAAAPSLANSANSGVYFGTNLLNLAVAGVLQWSIDNNGSLFPNLSATAPQIAAWDGAVGTPGLSFSLDPDTGLYRIGANDMALATAGVNRLEISSTGITSTLPIALTTAAAASMQVTGSSVNTGYGDQSVQFGLKNSSATTNNTVAFVATDNTFGTPAGSMEFKFIDRTNHYSEYTVITRGADGYPSRITASAAGVVIQGTITNDNAAAGKVGEYIVSNAAVAAFGGTTGQYNDLTSISLTAGDWDVTGNVMFVQNGATITDCTTAVSITAGNSGTGITTGLNQMETVSPTSAANTSSTIAAYRLSLSATTTVYLKANITFSAGSPKVLGSIHARRAR